MIQRDPPHGVGPMHQICKIIGTFSECSRSGPASDTDEDGEGLKVLHVMFDQLVSLDLLVSRSVRASQKLLRRPPQLSTPAVG